MDQFQVLPTRYIVRNGPRRCLISFCLISALERAILLRSRERRAILSFFRFFLETLALNSIDQLNSSDRDIL